MATSKQLNIADDSGDIFSKYIFEHKGFKELIIEFDRIHYDYQQGTTKWLLKKNLRKN